MVAGDMTIDWTINIGALLGGLLSGALAIVGTYGAMLRFWHKVDIRIHDAERTLKSHADALTEHGARASRHEQAMVEVMQDVARIFGALNPTTWTGPDRRRT
jgi:hypothetical protein